VSAAEDFAAVAVLALVDALVAVLVDAVATDLGCAGVARIVLVVAV
jgi:hypothetical protein